MCPWSEGGPSRHSAVDTVVGAVTTFIAFMVAHRITERGRLDG
jgi:hypothetical protein